MIGRLHFWCVVAVLALAPLPLASNRPWSWTLLALLVGLLCATWPLAARLDPDAPSVALRRVAAPAALFLAVLAWAGLQALPVWPEALAHPLWAMATTALGPLDGRIAVDPVAARDGLIRLATYGGVFLLALQHGRSARRARQLVEALALAGLAYAAYGLASHLSGAETILWLDKWAYRGRLTSTFVNANAYAAYAGLGLCCAVAAALRRLEGSRALLQRLLRLDQPAVWMLLAALATAAALPMTGSRGGIAAAVLALAVLLPARLGDPKRRARLALVGLGLALAVAVGLGVFLADAMAAAAADRLRVYVHALALVWERPLTGTGLGGFATGFAMIRPIEVTQTWSKAHSVYLELAIELGLPATLAFLAAVGLLARRCLRGVLERRQDRTVPALALAATVLMAAHGLVDFAPQIPAVAATWAALLGAGMAQSWSSRLGRAI